MFSGVFRKIAKAFGFGGETSGSDAEREKPASYSIMRFKCRNELDGIGRPRWWSVYGLVDKNGERCAVVHWQGWEDAGWKVIPESELEHIKSARPDPSDTEFYVLTPPHDIHRFGDCISDRLSPRRTIRSFKLAGDKLLAFCVAEDQPFAGWIDTEYLYDIRDPQFYPYYGI